MHCLILWMKSKNKKESIIFKHIVTVMKIQQKSFLIHFMRSFMLLYLNQNFHKQK